MRPSAQTPEAADESPEPRVSSGRREKLLFIFKLGVSLALLGYVAWKAGLDSEAGRTALFATIRSVNGLFLLLSLICGVTLTAISSWKWKVLLRSRAIEVPFTRLFLVYFIGRFFNLFLPTSMGGDVVRIWELGRDSGKRYEALASVFMERFSGMVTLALILIVTVVVDYDSFRLPVLTASLLFFAGIILAVFVIILNPRLLTLISAITGSRLPLLDHLFIRLHRAQQAVLEYRDDPSTLLKVFAISCLFYFMAVVNVWVTALAFSPEVSFASMLLAVPAIMLVMNLPFSIGGIGLLEAAFALLFPLFGYPAALALSTALLMRLKTIIYGIAGGLIHLGRLRVQPLNTQKP